MNAHRERVTALVLGAGEGRRLGGQPKAFLMYEQETLLERAVTLARAHAAEVIVGVREVDLGKARALVADESVTIVSGGATFQETFWNLFSYATRSVVLQLLVARPFVTNALVEQVLETAMQKGAAVVAEPLKVRDEFGVVQGDRLKAMVDRQQLVAIRGPRAYRKDWLAAARMQDDLEESVPALLTRLGFQVHWVEDIPGNAKITYPEDFLLL